MYCFEIGFPNPQKLGRRVHLLGAKPYPTHPSSCLTALVLALSKERLLHPYASVKTSFRSRRLLILKRCISTLWLRRGGRRSRFCDLK